MPSPYPARDADEGPPSGCGEEHRIGGEPNGQIHQGEGRSPQGGSPGQDPGEAEREGRPGGNTRTPYWGFTDIFFAYQLVPSESLSISASTSWPDLRSWMVAGPAGVWILVILLTKNLVSAVVPSARHSTTTTERPPGFTWVTLPVRSRRTA